MDEIKHSKRIHEIVVSAAEKMVNQILKEKINPTGLASMFLDQAMGFLNSNIQYCLKNDDPKGALSYLNIFMMDWESKTTQIQENIKRLQDSLDGTEKDGAEVHGVRFDPREINKGKMECHKCKIEMVNGKALKEIWDGIPDFIGDDKNCTLSPSGRSDMVRVWKCPQCGHSVTK